MKIVQLFKLYWPDNGGGIATVMERIAEAFPDCEQEIVVCHDKRGKKTSKDVYKGTLVHRSRQLLGGAATPISFRFLKDMKRYTKDADIVIYHFPYPLIDLAIWLKLFSGKLVVWWHCEPVKLQRFMPLYAPFVRHTLKHAKQILASSEENICHSKFLIPHQNKCTVIPYCVRDDYLQEGKELVNNHKSGSQKTILFIGRLTWYKGCDILLEAFANMQQKDCRLVLVGGGPMEQKLREHATRLGIAVEFTGIVSEEEKKRRIRECDFLVLPSISKAEAFAIVQIEAMAYGKPVINTYLPSGVPLVSKHGATGITVEPGDVGQLTAAMDRLMEDENLRSQYGQNAYELVQKEYTKAKMMERHRAVFQEIQK